MHDLRCLTPTLTGSEMAAFSDVHASHPLIKHDDDSVCTMLGGIAWEREHKSHFHLTKLKHWKKPLENASLVFSIFFYRFVICNKDAVGTYMFRRCLSNDYLGKIKHKRNSFWNSNRGTLNALYICPQKVHETYLFFQPPLLSNEHPSPESTPCSNHQFCHFNLHWTQGEGAWEALRLSGSGDFASQVAECFQMSGVCVS